MSSPLFEPLDVGDVGDTGDDGDTGNAVEALGDRLRSLDLAMGTSQTDTPGVYEDVLPFAPSPDVLGVCAAAAALPSARRHTPNLEPVVLHTNTNCLKQLPLQRQKIVARKGVSFTIMLVGESGLGKTTFINTLFCDQIKDAAMSSPRNESGPNRKTASLDIRQVEYVEKGFKGQFTIVESCGFGDYTNNKSAWIPLCQYIDAQHAMYMCEEEQPHREELVDTRVHVCLYFIYPSGHGLLPLDIVSMQELSRRVNLIPVIAKADCFGTEELENFKAAVRRDIEQHEISVFHPPTDLNAGEGDRPSWPYSVIASEKTVEVDGVQVRGRQYRWGASLVDDPEHCDFIKLSQVLMGSNMLDLIDTTHEIHYERQRRLLMQQRLKASMDAEPKKKDFSVTGDVATKVPGEKKSVTFKSPVVSSSDECDVAEFNSLELLAKISPFGYEYLRTERLENNALFLLGVRNARAEMDRVMMLQDESFRKWKEDILESREMFQEELEKLHRTVVGLQDTIKHLESHHHHRH